MPISSRGVIAAVASAAIVHQLIPWEPVWLATITGSVWASNPVRSEAKKYSFQHRISERMKAATIPGSAIGMTMRRNAPQIGEPSPHAAGPLSGGEGAELA